MKYKVIPKSSNKSHYDEDGSWSLVENLTIFEEEIGPEFTGILNEDGDPIYRYHYKNKIGFDTGTQDDDEYYEEY